MEVVIQFILSFVNFVKPSYCRPSFKGERERSMNSQIFDIWVILSAKYHKELGRKFTSLDIPDIIFAHALRISRGKKDIAERTDERLGRPGQQVRGWILVDIVRFPDRLNVIIPFCSKYKSIRQSVMVISPDIPMH